MPNTPLPGYDTSFGNHKAAVLRHFGPNPYVAGGYSLTAHELGWGGIEAVFGGNPAPVTVGGVTFPVALRSISGNFFATIEFATSAVGAAASLTVKWYVATTGVEVTTVSNTDLSAEELRVFLLGC